MKPALAYLLMLVLVVGGCRDKAPPRPDVHPRIVSCAPALTEMLFSMGLGDHVVAVTSYCVLPEGVTRPVVGNLARPASPEQLLSLRPDVIVIQQNPADFQAAARALPNASIEHFVIEDLAGIGQALQRLGALAGRADVGLEHRQRFEARLDGVRRRAEGLDRPTVYFLTSVHPLAVAGRDSFVHELIGLAGGQDLSGQFARWGRISAEHIIRDRPQVIIAQVGAADGLAATDAAVADARQYLLSLPDVPAAVSGRVHVVTDRYWTMPTPRLAELAEHLLEMLHPEARETGP